MKLGTITRRWRRRWLRKAVMLCAAVILSSMLTGEWSYAGSEPSQPDDRVEGTYPIAESGREQYASSSEREIGAELAATYERLKNGQPVPRSDRPYTVPDSPTVYLTFDDGPSGLTPQILDILQQEGVQATFFVLGEQAERYADTVQRIVKDGHAIGNHTYNHRYEELYTDFASYLEQVSRTDEIIYQLTDVRTDLFRTPGGTYTNFDNFYSYYMDQTGLTVYDWNVDGGDSRRRGVPAGEIIANVKSAPLNTQMNVLLHDGGGHGETVKALPEIIRYFKSLGYRFAPLDASVEPSRFTLGRLKWTRTTSWDDHLRYMDMIADFRLGRDKGSIEAPRAAEERLILQVDGRRYVLEGEDYYVLDGHYQVTLERLAEALGGTGIQRQAAGEGKITVSINGGKMTYDLSDKSVTVRQRVGRTWLTPHVQVTVKDGRVFAPLRGTVEALGGWIPSYSLTDAEKVVQVRMYDQPEWPLLKARSTIAKKWAYLAV